MNDQAIEIPIRTPTQTDDDLAYTYLQQLLALACEISLAMEAIAGNALTSFRESVARQEMLCDRLAGIGGIIHARCLSRQGLLVVSDPSVEERIRETSEAIRRLNLQYAALLRHSGRSVALLASLCRSHTGQFQEARGPRLKHQTWSCEM
jgi:hypothetical protein